MYFYFSASLLLVDSVSGPHPNTWWPVLPVLLDGQGHGQKRMAHTTWTIWEEFKGGGCFQGLNSEKPTGTLWNAGCWELMPPPGHQGEGQVLSKVTVEESLYPLRVSLQGL